MTTTSLYWKRTQRFPKFIHPFGPGLEIDTRAHRHCRRVEVERANDTHRLSLGGRLAIAPSLLPRAGRGIRIFQDMIA
jgi:hypothetical protein